MMLLLCALDMLPIIALGWGQIIDSELIEVEEETPVKAPEAVSPQPEVGVSVQTLITVLGLTVVVTVLVTLALYRFLERREAATGNPRNAEVGKTQRKIMSRQGADYAVFQEECPGQQGMSERETEGVRTSATAFANLTLRSDI